MSHRFSTRSDDNPAWRPGGVRINSGGGFDPFRPVWSGAACKDPNDHHRQRCRISPDFSVGHNLEEDAMRFAVIRAVLIPEGVLIEQGCWYC
jgi:hypothetical protein